MKDILHEENTIIYPQVFLLEPTNEVFKIMPIRNQILRRLQKAITIEQNFLRIRRPQ